jgi:hypothetical protein
MSLPLMPKATAVWLVENTTLTFKQIADFCGMHELEVKGIADGEVAQGIMGMDPVVSGEVTREELERCMQNPSARLQLSTKATQFTQARKKKQSRYTPIARRQDKPDAIAWLIKNCPDIQDSQIVKLIGTTKQTIQALKDKEHWNMKNIRPRDPVLLGLCTQTELDKLLATVGRQPEGKSE